jgi:hypothetical protein
MPRPATLVSWALVALLVLAYGCEQRKVGRAQAGEVAARRALDSLATIVRRVDTVYRIQRDTFYVRRVRLDTLTVTVDRWKHDTLEVVRYVAAADSTVRACSLALATCDERDALRVRQLDAWEQRWATREKPRSALWVWVERAVISGVSFKLGQASVPR